MQEMVLWADLLGISPGMAGSHKQLKVKRGAWLLTACPIILHLVWPCSLRASLAESF